MNSTLCNSRHKWTDSKCVRPAGHDGYCWTKAWRRASDGSINRVVWYINQTGQCRHVSYDTKYPSNMQVAVTKP